MARQASEQTVAIRKLLDESKGEITHSQAVPRLAEAGFKDVDAPTFNGIKAIWKKANRNGKGNRVKRKGESAPEVTVERALATVREYGGLKAAKAFARTLLASIKVAEQEVAALVG